MNSIEWKILGKVIWEVSKFILVLVAILGGFVLLVEFVGPYAILLLPALILVYLIKSLYEDELVKQGKRLHHK